MRSIYVCVLVFKMNVYKPEDDIMMTFFIVILISYHVQHKIQVIKTDIQIHPNSLMYSS